MPSVHISPSVTSLRVFAPSATFCFSQTYFVLLESWKRPGRFGGMMSYWMPSHAITAINDGTSTKLFRQQWGHRKGFSFRFECNDDSPRIRITVLGYYKAWHYRIIHLYISYIAYLFQTICLQWQLYPGLLFPGKTKVQTNAMLSPLSRVTCRIPKLSSSSTNPARFSISSTPHIRLFKTQATNPAPFLTSSCVPIQYFAPVLCTVSNPFCPPRLSLPPNHQGFHTSCRPCSKAVTRASPEDFSCSRDTDGDGMPWGVYIIACASVLARYVIRIAE